MQAKQLTGIRGAPCCALVALALCSFMLAPVVAADAVDAHAPATIVLAGDAHYPPFQFINDEGHASGFDVALLRALAKQQHLNVVTKLGDWRNAISGLTKGNVDVVPMFITPARSQLFAFSKPFLLRYHLVFARRGSAHISALSQLVGRRVAVQYDSTAREALESLHKRVQIIPTDVEGKAIVALHDGKADFALVPIEIGYKSIIDHDYHDIVAISPPLLERQYAFAVKRGNTALLAHINAGLAQAHSNGTLDALYLKWLANLDPHAVSSARSRWLAWALAGLVAFFVVVIGLWLRARRQAKTQTSLAATESSSRRHAEAQVEHLAWHDAATDLPNLNALLARMHEAVRKEQRFGLVRIDILRLDLTQATAGSRFTDELLLALAQRLQQAASAGAVAALGRGLFAVMLKPLDGHREASQRMRALVDTMHHPLQLGDIVLQQRCRAGLAYYPLDANDAEGMLRAAETACSAAHEQAVTMLNYAPQLEPDPRNLTLLADLAQAINEHSLGYAMQPKYALPERSFCGAELLARWEHPRYGMLSPSQFVPLAEKTGAISALTLYVVRAAVIQWQRWRAHGATLAVAVNISVNDLADETLIARIVSLCHQIGPALTLEITETEMIRDPQRALAALARLRSTGLRISLDDFGTGHSSLTYLRQLSPDEVKIDRSFIARMLTSPDDQAIVLACIALAHELGTKVVAEGVEDEATLDWLAEHGCDVAQGYALAKPMPPDAIFQRYAAASVA